MTTGWAFEGESETVGVAVAHRKAADRELAGVDDLACRQRNELQRNRRTPLAPKPRKHPDDDIESG